MIYKSSIPKSSSLDSLHLQLNIQESILTSTKNQDGVVSRVIDRNRRKDLLPTPNRPKTSQAAEITQTQETEENLVPNQQQHIKVHPPPITEELISQTTINRMNHSHHVTNKYFDNSIPMDKKNDGSSKSIHLIQQSTDFNVDTQFQTNGNDYEDPFDDFILNNFIPFSGKQNVVHWLEEA
jgi:hypothetical protein